MSDRKTLREYLSSLNIELGTTSGYTQCVRELRDCSFDAFLNETTIELRKESHLIEGSNEFDATSSYPKFVDNLLQKTSLVTKSSQHNVSETSFLCSQLNHFHWEALCLCVGRQNFLDLLCALSSFKQMNGVTLHLPLLGSKSHDSRIKRHHVKNSRMYYKWRPSFHKTRLIRKDPQELLYDILELSTRPRNIPKKYRKFHQVLRIACHNEARLDYVQVLNRNVLQAKSDKIFENCTPINEVAEFVILVFQKIFSGALGCNKNQKLVKESIIRLLKKSKNDSLDWENVANSLNVSSIKWLGKSESMSSLQDLTMRRETLHKFMKWLYTALLVSLISNIWYVTENVTSANHDGIGAMYFLHSAWRDLTKTWLTRYSEKHLHEITEQEELETGHSEFNFGVLRLIPKKADFRPLCVPWKRVNSMAQAKEVDDERGRRAFKYHDFNSIRPIRDILRYQQAKKLNPYPNMYPRCYSVSDVGSHFSVFKKKLLSDNQGIVPNLFGVQFDMKHCYDNLNQAKIISSIEDLFESEHSDEEFVVKKYLQFPRVSQKKGIYKRARSTIKQRANIEELDFCKFKPLKIKSGESFIEKARVSKFSKSDIIDVVRNQVLDSVMKIPELGQKLFRRTIGVYQGLPLLETLCDIVYNALVDSVLTLDDSAEHGTFLFLRLADDFLFISTRKEDCDSILNRANSVEAQKFGAFVNQDKCHEIASNMAHFSTANFLGLQIDLEDLSIRRNESQRMIPVNTRKSFEATLIYLQWRCKLRLSGYLLDMNLLSLDVIATNVVDALDPILNCAVSQFRVDRRRLELTVKFESFLCEMIYTVIHSFEAINGKSKHTDFIFKVAWDILTSHTAKEGISVQNLQSLLGCSRSN